MPKIVTIFNLAKDHLSPEVRQPREKIANKNYCISLSSISSSFPSIAHTSVLFLNMASSLPPGIDPAKLPSMAPPSGFASNFVNPVTLADTIIAVSATTSILAVALLSMRLYSTLGITRSASGDDAASVLAMVFSLAYTGLIVNTRDNARHGWDLPISAFTAGYFKIILSETIIAALGLLFSKLSILLLLFRLFSPTQTFRYLVYTAIVWATLISSVTIVVASALCTPRSGESFGSLTVVERCSHQQTWAVVQGALNMPLDFYILYLPIPMVWKLQMRPKRKIGVTAIFMTGFMYYSPSPCPYLALPD